jgi:hypothetical protein
LRATKLDKIKDYVMKAHALKFDVDPDGDYMRPGNSPPERAFMVLNCMYPMLLTMLEMSFPAVDARTRKRGAKWTRQSLLYQAGESCMVLANAVTTLMVETEGKLASDQPPVVGVEEHQRLKDAIFSFYPLPVKAANIIPGCAEEFEVMRTHQPREQVAEGKQEPNEYSAALLRGENPDEDPRLVQIQKEYARDFFIDRANFQSIRIAMHAKDRVLLRDKMVRFINLKGKESEELRQRALAGWIKGLEPYHEYALLDSQSP